jgi:hypothetical protein
MVGYVGTGMRELSAFRAELCPWWLIFKTPVGSTKSELPRASCPPCALAAGPKRSMRLCRSCNEVFPRTRRVIPDPVAGGLANRTSSARTPWVTSFREVVLCGGRHSQEPSATLTHRPSVYRFVASAAEEMGA